MAQIPDQLTNKFNQFVRNVLIGGGLFAALGAAVNYSDGNGGGMILLGALAFGAFGCAAKIKVHYRLKGGVAVYE